MNIKIIIQMAILFGLVIVLFLQHGFIGLLLLGGIIWIMQDEYKQSIQIKNKLKTYQEKYGDL